MSGPVKRRTGAGGGGPHKDASETEDYFVPNEEIQVDFEGRSPLDVDFHGIKTMLQQLFLKAHVNLSELSNLIIGQNFVGSVIKQSELDIPDDELDEDPDDANDVFGITTVVSLNQRQECECIQQVRQLLSDLAEEHAPDPMKKLIRNVLGTNSALLLNERLVNIPPQISAPLFNSLRDEINAAIVKGQPFNFDYYVLISKMYKADVSKNSNKSNKNKDLENIWSNAEEEVIQSEALGFFEFSVKSESDSGLTGNWLEEDSKMIPYRRVLIIDAKKFDSIVDTVKTYVS